jgi:predicted ArsR family transcriptional regulator
MTVEKKERGPAAATSPGVPRRSADGRRHTAAREQLLRTLEAQTAPVSVSALSRATGLHENTVRGHLDQLLADGHATRSPAPAEGRGRPAWLWRPTRHGPASPYAALAGVLAETIARTSSRPAETAHEAGLSWGRRLLPDLPAGPGLRTDRERVLRVMEDQGFDPADEGEHIALRRCPLLEAAQQHPEVVCAVHRGLVDALLAPGGDGMSAAEENRSRRADEGGPRPADEAETGSAARSRAELEPFAAPGLCRLRLEST